MMNEHNSLLYDQVLESAGQQTDLNSSNKYLIFPDLSAVSIGNFSARAVAKANIYLHCELQIVF